jgi:hypothetical protein
MEENQMPTIVHFDIPVDSIERAKISMKSYLIGK